jgi:N-hydroxyarylamine O-acetyltransferase
MSAKLNLRAYFERIGFSGSIAPTASTLALLHALHPAAIPFENLDPLLGLPVSLKLADIERKLVLERRGGYCFEHNLLFLAVLRELDFTVRPLAARVVWSNPEGADAAPMHMLLAVEISGATYIADVGFGGLTLTAPLKLRADVEEETPHERFRLARGETDWRLEVELQPGEWRGLYHFTTDEWAEAEYAAANLALARGPDSPFTRELRVALSPTEKRMALRNDRLSTYRVGEPAEVRTLTSVVQMREVLAGTFGLDLPQTESLDETLATFLPIPTPLPEMDG